MHLQKIQLITSDLERCRLFYGATLGLEIEPAGSGDACFKVGDSLLSFSETKGSQPLYHFAFSVPNNLLGAALEWLGERTTILPYAPDSVIADFVNWNAKAFYFRDPDGNILECITHFDEGTRADLPFSPAYFGRILEIGLPVEDVTLACAELNERYGIPYFVKGPRLRDFSVMGDAEGMLIVTKKGRGWLPTQETAKPFPTTLIIRHSGKKIELEFFKQ
jgi:catechol 2,3-dioxygenase-like lactoylglutathione lyase family enzyme